MPRLQALVAGLFPTARLVGQDAGEITVTGCARLGAMLTAQRGGDALANKDLPSPWLFRKPLAPRTLLLGVEGGHLVSIMSRGQPLPHTAHIDIGAGEHGSAPLNFSLFEEADDGAAGTPRRVACVQVRPREHGGVLSVCVAADGALTVAQADATQEQRPAPDACRAVLLRMPAAARRKAGEGVAS